MKKKELRQLNDAELDKMILDLNEDIEKLRFQKATGQLENSHLIRNKRRDLARVLTLIKEREKQVIAKQV